MSRSRHDECPEEESYNCPGCGSRIPGTKNRECEEFVCQACLYTLRWKEDGARGRWVLAVLGD